MNKNEDYFNNLTSNLSSQVILLSHIIHKYRTAFSNLAFACNVQVKYCMSIHVLNEGIDN